MNLRFYIICIAAVLTLVVPAVADNNSTAKVYGGVYSSDNFEPLDNAIVNVNTTPSQSMVAKSGMYFFDLEPGNYSITAKYYENNTLVNSAAETIIIKGGGSYRRDLLLLPVYSAELMEGSKLNLSSNNSVSGSKNPVVKVATDKANASNNVNIPEQSRIYSSTISSILVAITLFLLLAVGYSLSKKHKKIEKNGLREEKDGHLTGNFSRAAHVPESSVKPQDKSIDPEVRKDLQVNTEEIAYITESVSGSKSAIGSEPGSVSQTPIMEESGTELESKISLAKPVVESESKVLAAEQVIKLESRQAEKKVTPENQEENSVQEAESIESEKMEKNQNNSPEESADDSEIKIAAPKKKLPLPADLQQVMDIIRGHGGRITQKDLRSKLKYSEGKVSLMLADLERRELIEKFKRGRGNIVILKDEER
jgi:uncharacterized membrane protein